MLAVISRQLRRHDHRERPARGRLAGATFANWVRGPRGPSDHISPGQEALAAEVEICLGFGDEEDVDSLLNRMEVASGAVWQFRVRLDAEGSFGVVFPRHWRGG